MCFALLVCNVFYVGPTILVAITLYYYVSFFINRT